jgi:5'-deoxynucleotidase YfbR-like HD superfamily hydrolase
MRTYSGKFINLMQPNADDITIEDIAIGLSRKFRFAGQTTHPLTVSQHLVNCMSMAHTELKLDALMHDAGEAFTSDVPKPIKMMIPQFETMENELMRIIAMKFGCDNWNSESIKQLDRQLLEYEWSQHVIADIAPVWSMEYALFRWCMAYEGLTGKKVNIKIPCR